MSAKIVVDNLKKSFATDKGTLPVVGGVSFTVADGEFIAIDTALARLQPGDLCLILIDQVDEALAHIAMRIGESGITPG